MARAPDNADQQPSPAAQGTTQPPASEAQAPAADVQPGDQILNPSQPLAPTVVPQRADVSKFLAEGQAASGYPKWLYHPVHGGVEIKDPAEEARLKTRQDWFPTPELADASRTATEAWIAHAHNLRAKLKSHDDAGHAVVRNSVAADEEIRAGQPEPL